MAYHFCELKKFEKLGNWIESLKWLLNKIVIDKNEMKLLNHEIYQYNIKQNKKNRLLKNIWE